MDTSFFKENPFTTEETCIPKPRYGETFYPLSTAREWDAESSTYHYRARQYNQYIGRFITRDPIEYWGGLNLFAYVKNNPINLVDPYGFSPEIKRRCMKDPYGISKIMEVTYPPFKTILDEADLITYHYSLADTSLPIVLVAKNPCRVKTFGADETTIPGLQFVQGSIRTSPMGSVFGARINNVSTDSGCSWEWMGKSKGITSGPPTVGNIYVTQGLNMFTINADVTAVPKGDFIAIALWFRCICDCSTPYASSNNPIMTGAFK